MFNVICINKGENNYLTTGKIYQVLSEGVEHYLIHSDYGVKINYRKELFNVVTQKIKVLCVDKGNYSYIKSGKIYEAEDYNTNYYQLVNDEGDVVLYRKTYFIVRVSSEAAPVSTPIKPPLGLKPREIYWEELNYHRRQDIIAAMHRYMEAKMDIPVEWCKELIDLVIADNKGEIQC